MLPASWSLIRPPGNVVPLGLPNPQNTTVDGCEILRQLIGGKHPIIYRLSTIPGGAGFRNHPQLIHPLYIHY
jgi:hypothetical protein